MDTLILGRELQGREQLAPSTWVSGAGGLLTQCPVSLAFLQMCVPGMFFLVESHFAISCPVPGYSLPTPFLPARSPGSCFSGKSFLSRQQCLSGARNPCTSCLAPIALLERALGGCEHNTLTFPNSGRHKYTLSQSSRAPHQRPCPSSSLLVPWCQSSPAQD